MPSIKELGRKAWRKYVVDGVSSSLPNKPATEDIFPFVDAIDAAFAAEAAAREDASAGEANAREAAVAALGEQIEAASAGTVLADSWPTLATIEGTRAGQPAQVPTGDEGTHTDPVVGGTVANSGNYAWVPEEGWQRISNFQVSLPAATETEALEGNVFGSAMVPNVTFETYGTGNEGQSLNLLDGLLAEGRYLGFHWNANGQALFSYDLVDHRYDIDVRGVSELIDGASLNFLYQMQPEDGTFPLAVNRSGKVLLGIDMATGQVTGSFKGISTTQPSEDVADAGMLGYVDDGTLRAIGGTAGDRLLDDEEVRTWLAGDTAGAAFRAVYEDEDGYRHFARVSLSSGDLYSDGEVTLWTSDGQSNAEAQSGSVSAIVQVDRFGGRLRMPTPDVWAGLVTSNGGTIELDPDTVTGLVPLLDSLIGTHGTTEVAGALRAEMSAALAGCDWLPDMVGWNNAEGGQTMVNLLPDPPSGFYAFANATALLTKAVSLLEPGKRMVWRWQFMAQGEAQTSDATLGSLHEEYRAACEEMAQPITGQTEPLRMLTWQMSSHLSSFAATQSILDYALANYEPYGRFWCAGPTYPFPFNTDYLHQLSVGHMMRGEMARAMAKRIEKTGTCLPLHMTEAHVTGTNEITVTLSEEAVADTSWLIASIANSGIKCAGVAVTAVAVDGTTMTITTNSAATNATSVQAAMNLQSNPRTAANIPRSTIRSVASLGTFSDDCGDYTGIEMHKALCQQQIAIS